MVQAFLTKTCSVVKIFCSQFCNVQMTGRVSPKKPWMEAILKYMVFYILSLDVANDCGEQQHGIHVPKSLTKIRWKKKVIRITFSRNFFFLNVY